MQEPKLGVQETKELTTAVAKISNGVGAVLEDGEVNWKDIPKIPKLLSAAKDLKEVDFAALLPEVSDLDETEQKELADHFIATFDLPQDGVEDAIEQGFELLLACIGAVLTLVEIGKKVKAKVA